MLIYEDHTFDPSKGTSVMVVYCLRCGHSESEHLPNREGCTREWMSEPWEQDRKIHSCGCRDWDPSDPTPLRGKVTLDVGFVHAPYIPEGVTPRAPK